MAFYGKIDTFPVSIKSNNGVATTHTISKVNVDKEEIAI
ncbi:MAG: hypothetical protein A4E65_03749 [Syntrophorhabdus sp. PtaU1.Bin153]|nr:MAG: hypothetical protein A4E65_03749 [Syntrophorhabdus sp. PtaU1.Bin153]